nr:hypothetical protein [Tanacetum cinerariifolium]
MYYPRFTKVVIHHFMSKDLSIPRRNKINWHYVRDDNIFLTIKVVSRHQDTQQYGAILPIELTNEDIRNTMAYKEYYAYATGVAAPKPKASARKKRTVKDGSERYEDDDDNDDEEELAKNDDEDTASDRGGDEISENEGESDEEETRQEEEESFDPISRTPEGSEDEGNDEEDQDLRLSEEARIQEEKEADELYRDVDINQGRGLQVTQNIEDSHVTLTPVHPDVLQESSSVSSFLTSMLNPISDAGVESIFTTASSPIVSLQTPMTPSTIATITTSSDVPIPPTTIPSTILEILPTFNLVFCFDERLRSLETTFSEYRKTNPFVNAVSAILVVAAPRLSAIAKGKQPARATTPTELIDVERTEAEQLKIVLKKSRPETHISQQRGFGTDEGTGSRPGVLDVPSDDSEEELSWNSSDDEDVDEQTKGREETEGDKTDESDDGSDDGNDDDNDETVKEQVSRILPRIEESVNATLEAEVLTRSSHSSRTLYAIAPDLSEMELKKILIEKMEGNKSIQRSDEQRNLYKALVEAYDADKTILDTYGESTILKRRREDDDQEGPSAGSDWGSKRRREGGEHASASTPSETATRNYLSDGGTLTSGV